MRPVGGLTGIGTVGASRAGSSTIEGTSIVYSISMGAAQPFLFATADGKNWMHGPERVRFRDRGHSGVFRWGDFRLEVEHD